MIDTHTHLYDVAFKDDYDDAVQRAFQAGVSHFIFPGTDSTEHDRMLAYADRYPQDISVCIGLHPTSVREDWEKELGFVETHLPDRHWCAIGEIGIDGYWSKEFIGLQQKVLEQQMRWAADLNLPVIIHLRESQDALFEVFDTLRKEGVPMKGVFHAFSGSIETYRRIMTYGDFMVGIGGVLTYRKASIAETLRDIPLEKILLETDSPYLPPVPHRGKRNESAFVVHTANRIAEIKGCDIRTVDDITTQNAIKLFNLA